MIELLSPQAAQLYWRARSEDPHASLKDSATQAAEAVLWTAAQNPAIVSALADHILATAVTPPTATFSH